MRDVIIIGAGISGITAAIYLKRAGKDVLLIEKGMLGGTVNKTSSIENYPTIKSITGPDFASLLFEQVMDNQIDICFDEVIDVTLEKEYKIVKLKDKEIKCRYLVLATGKDIRKLNVQNEEGLTGHGVSYCALCDGPLYKNKEVVVVGSGTAALSEALYLSNICKKVTIISKYNTFKTKENLLDMVNERKNIHVIYEGLVTKFNGRNNKLTSVEYELKGIKKKIKAEGCFIYIGSTPNIFSNLALELENNYIKVNSEMETSIKGIYAIGDVIKKDVYQLVTATSDGAVAASSIIKEMNKK